MRVSWTLQSTPVEWQLQLSRITWNWQTLALAGLAGRKCSKHRAKYGLSYFLQSKSSSDAIRRQVFWRDFLRWHQLVVLLIDNLHFVFLKGQLEQSDAISVHELCG